MCTDSRTTSARRRTLRVLWGAGVWLAGATGFEAVAQVAGQGAGVHSPQSPVPPLPARKDVVPWSTLTATKLKYVHTYRRLVPSFPPEVEALHQTRVRIQGFMRPLSAGATQTGFLLTSVPTGCAFCTPGGPESMVDVRARKPVKYVDEGVVMEGRLLALVDDPQGLYYRLIDAVQVP